MTPPPPGAGQGDPVAAAPLSISDAWSHFKIHGSLPAPVGGEGGPSSEIRGAGGGRKATPSGGGRSPHPEGSLLVPPSMDSAPDPFAATLYSVIVTDNTLATIPGVGADCGLPERFSKRLIHCSGDPAHKHYEVGGSSCGKPSCPRHWKTWARQAADRAGCILWGYKAASKGRRNPRQTVLSEKDDSPFVLKRASFSDRANIRYFRKYFEKKALALGGTGGSIVVHLWRTTDEVPDWIDGKKRWAWVREHGPGWVKYKKFSPHAHITGYGSYRVPEKGEFPYKNFEALEDRDAVESVVFYQLSHAPIGAGCNAIAYWGCCAPGYLKVAVVDGRKQEWTECVPCFCEECGLPMIYNDGEEFARRRSCAVYEIVKPPPRKKKGAAPGGA